MTIMNTVTVGRPTAGGRGAFERSSSYIPATCRYRNPCQGSEEVIVRRLAKCPMPVGTCIDPICVPTIDVKHVQESSSAKSEYRAKLRIMRRAAGFVLCVLLRDRARFRDTLTCGRCGIHEALCARCHSLRSHLVSFAPEATHACHTTKRG